ncbi:MAG: hypothetical protein GY858_01255 [Candidatus Omnitrophica bacterium]|nr:hypothetical protein [Candidatus Omnitrophota bacterium]
MKGLIRVWKELDLADVEKYLFVVGELSAECFACHKVGINKRDPVCPGCGTHFKYIGFRRKIDVNYLNKMKGEFGHLIFIDFDDFKKIIGKRDARKLLDL